MKHRFALTCLPRFSLAAFLALSAVAPAAPAAAADLCVALENLRKRDLREATGLYKSCRDANELFDRANADLGMRAIFNRTELEAYIPSTQNQASLTSRRKAFAWIDAVNQAVRQNAAAFLLLERERDKAKTEASADPDLNDPRRLARIEAALEAQAKVNLKGENLKRYLILQTEKIRDAEHLERAMRAFFEEEPTSFRAPASIN